MASTLEALIQKLSQTGSYTPLTDEEMRQQAQTRYQSAYDEKRLSARQAYETSDQALLRELERLSGLYDAQRAQRDQQYRAASAQADRHALTRGMQRSSYNGATLSNIRLAGEGARAALDREQAQAQGDVGEKRTLLSTQLAQQLKQYDLSQQSDILSYIDQLEAREHDRLTKSQQQQNDIAMKLYEYQHQLEQEAAEQARWQAEFNATYGSSSRRRGGGSSSSKKKGSGAGAGLVLEGGVRV